MKAAVAVGEMSRHRSSQPIITGLPLTKSELKEIEGELKMDWKKRSEKRAEEGLFSSDYRNFSTLYKDGYLAGVRDALEEAARVCERQATLVPNPRMNRFASRVLNTAEFIRALGEGL